MITKAPDQLKSRRDMLRSAACSFCLLAAVLRPVGLFAEDHPKADPHCGTNTPAARAGGLCCSNPQAMPDGSDQPMDVGLAIGQKAPSFILKDQNGKDISLEEMLKKGPVALVFYRSADWCLFCKFELKIVQHRLDEFQAAGGQVVAISYDSVPILKRFAESQHITFPLLSDETSQTIGAYRMDDCQATDPKQRFSAHASFVVDQGGVVRAKFIGVIYQEQPGMGILLKGIREAHDSQPKAVKGG
jgi:peroxiredoxin